MIEYPSINNSSKAPRLPCIAFDKLDGSNFRAKFTPKQGFCNFGTRTQLIDETTPFWCDMVNVFRGTLEQTLSDIFKKDTDFRNFREIIVFGEYLGENSFAGQHVESDPKKIVVFDVLLGHKNRFFLKPQDFIKKFEGIIETPRVVYSGNLNEEFINDVRENKFGLKEGVICKGTEKNGAYRGGIWNCKIKTLEYLNKLKEKFGSDWTKYGE